MNISETIKSLPPGAITVLVGGNTKGSIGSKLELTVAGLQRLVTTLEKCETAIEGIGQFAGLNIELLGEIREALGK